MEVNSLEKISDLKIRVKSLNKLSDEQLMFKSKGVVLLDDKTAKECGLAHDSKIVASLI